MAIKAGLLGSAGVDGTGGVSRPYVVPASSKAAVTAALCNTTAAAIKVRLGYTTGGAASPTAGQWLIGGSAGRYLGPGETIQVTTMLGTGQGLAAGADAVGVNLTINGIEEAL